MGRTSLNNKNMKEELEQKLEQLNNLKKEVADGMLEESWIKPGDVIEFGLNQIVGVLESRVVFLGDGKPEINLTCCEFTRTSFINALPSTFLTEYTLSSLEAENVKVIGKFTWEESSVSGGSNLKTIKLLTMTLDRK